MPLSENVDYDRRVSLNEICCHSKQDLWRCRLSLASRAKPLHRSYALLKTSASSAFCSVASFTGAILILTPLKSHATLAVSEAACVGGYRRGCQWPCAEGISYVITFWSISMPSRLPELVVFVWSGSVFRCHPFSSVTLSEQPLANHTF